MKKKGKEIGTDLWSQSDEKETCLYVSYLFFFLRVSVCFNIVFSSYYLVFPIIKKHILICCVTTMSSCYHSRAAITGLFVLFAKSGIDAVLFSNVSLTHRLHFLRPIFLLRSKFFWHSCSHCNSNANAIRLQWEQSTLRWPWSDPHAQKKTWRHTHLRK